MAPDALVPIPRRPLFRPRPHERPDDRGDQTQTVCPCGRKGANPGGAPDPSPGWCLFLVRPPQPDGHKPPAVVVEVQAPVIGKESVEVHIPPSRICECPPPEAGAPDPTRPERTRPPPCQPPLESRQARRGDRLRLKRSWPALHDKPGADQARVCHTRRWRAGASPSGSFANGGASDSLSTMVSVIGLRSGAEGLSAAFLGWYDDFSLPCSSWLS